MSSLIRLTITKVIEQINKFSSSDYILYLYYSFMNNRINNMVKQLRAYGGCLGTGRR